MSASLHSVSRLQSREGLVLPGVPRDVRPFPGGRAALSASLHSVSEDWSLDNHNTEIVWLVVGVLFCTLECSHVCEHHIDWLL